MASKFCSRLCPIPLLLGGEALQGRVRGRHASDGTAHIQGLLRFAYASSLRSSFITFLNQATNSDGSYQEF
jgi:predicted alpha/beta-hydrolase family hydrolase